MPRSSLISHHRLQFHTNRRRCCPKLRERFDKFLCCLICFLFMFIFVLCRLIICFLWCTCACFSFFAAEMDTCIINRTFNPKRYILLPEADIVLLLYVRNWGTLLRKLPHWHIHGPDKLTEHSWTQGKNKSLKVSFPLHYLLQTLLCESRAEIGLDQRVNLAGWTFSCKAPITFTVKLCLPPYQHGLLKLFFNTWVNHVTGEQKLLLFMNRSWRCGRGSQHIHYVLKTSISLLYEQCSGMSRTLQVIVLIFLYRL